jgi:hypothetical protein
MNVAQQIENGITFQLVVHAETRELPRPAVEVFVIDQVARPTED